MSRSEPTDSRSEKPEPRRPIPVRQLVAADAAGVGTGVPEVVPDRRTLRFEDEEWNVEVIGSTRSGTGTDAGAPLLFLSFTHVDEGSRPEREALAVGTSLADFSAEELAECFARSRPLRTPGESRGDRTSAR